MPPRDDDLLPISALQHVVFCPRQAGLIHLEQVWEENRQTAEGRTLHERVDEGYREFRRGLRQFSGVRVQSLTLELYGRLDVLELEKGDYENATNVGFLGLEGRWSLRPVEFKRGEPKNDDCDAVQVCAQALCLEEMTGSVIASGAIFYGEIRRRIEVPLTPELRTRTMDAARKFSDMMRSKRLPPPLWKKGCRSCSLLDICQPKAGTKGHAEEYRKELLG